MSWSLSEAASGCITGLARTPERNSRSCCAMYTAFWPARRGHSGLVLLPSGPWQAAHTAALVAPSAALPLVNGKSLAAVLAGGAAAGALCAEADSGRRHASVTAIAAHAIRPTLRLCGIAVVRLGFRATRAPNCTLGRGLRFLSPRPMSRFNQVALSHQRGARRAVSRRRWRRGRPSSAAPTPASRAPSTRSRSVRVSRAPARPRGARSC